MCVRIGSTLGDFYSKLSKACVSTLPQHLHSLSDCAQYISAVHSGPAAWAQITAAAEGVIRSGEHARPREMSLTVRKAVAYMQFRRQEAGEEPMNCGEHNPAQLAIALKQHHCDVM